MDIRTQPAETILSRLLATLQTHAILFASAFMVVVATAYGMVPHA